MKKIAFAFLLTLATTATFAQTAATRSSAKTAQSVPDIIEQRVEEMTSTMARNLRLTPEQTQQVKSINRSSMLSAEAAKVKYKREPQQFVQQMDIISETRLSQLKDVLSPIQFQQYQKRREEKMGVPREAQSNPTSRQQGTAYQEN